MDWKHILVIGAGRSTASLIKYLLDNAGTEGWKVVVGDLSLDMAKRQVGDAEHGTAIAFDVNDEIQRVGEISKADLVISMLPASMHVSVARDCIALKKHMVTASYVSPEMKKLDSLAREAGVVLMNEIGVDPGIDHMSAMQVLDEIRNAGGTVSSFKSFTGGLVAPESDNNPWNYKFTWNPRNVVLAGQGGAAQFIRNGKYKYIPYHQLFRRVEAMEIEGIGKFEGYANRDSLSYRSVYGLESIPTILRGTLRRPGFARAWDVFVQLGMTDDTYPLEGSEKMTYRDFTNAFLRYSAVDSVELKLMHYLGLEPDSAVMERLEWLGMFSQTKLGLSNVTPAQALQHILIQKWTLDPTDKDMLVMWHDVGYTQDGVERKRTMSLVVIGDPDPYTAMAKTVGLPVAMATKLILNGTIHTPGVLLPITAEIYEPLLRELAEFGIVFQESDRLN